MTVQEVRDRRTAGTTVDPAEFDAAFAALLERVRLGTIDRDRDRKLLFEEVAELRTLGFASLRLPESLGGGGVGLEAFFERLIDLAAADPSLAHLYRGHIAFVEGLLLDGIGTGRPLTGHETRWVARLAAGELVGNAQSERQDTSEITTTLERDGDDVFVTGTKYYTTGSIYADWIHLSALDGDERVGVTADASHTAVRSIDDWDGFGQLLTGSGTTTFDRVPIDPADIVARGADDDDGRQHYLAGVFQLVLLAVVAGIAQAALADTVAFVRPRRRIFGFPGETPPREDALVQSVVGGLSASASAARAIVLQTARTLGTALDRRVAGVAGEHELRDAMLEAFRAQQVVLPLVLDAVTELFEVGGASAVGRGFALDRHWRNVRTIASHNPAVQRRRALGQFELNGTLPEWRAPGVANAPGAEASVTESVDASTKGARA